jgi:hypothetical protein
LRKFIGLTAMLAVFALAAPAALAIVDVNDQGEGFVGKGDVQLALGYNNKQLQDAEKAQLIRFRISSTEVTEWTCKRDAGTQTQVRHNTTTLQGLASKTAREQSKGKDGPVTGFFLLGFQGDPTEEHDGPAIGSCPEFWSEVDGSRTVTPGEGGGLQVSGDGGATWVSLG